MIHRCRVHVAERVTEKENEKPRSRKKTKIETGRLRMFHTVLSAHASSSAVCFFRVQTEGIIGIPEDRVSLSYGGSRLRQQQEEEVVLSERNITEREEVEKDVVVVREKKRIKITAPSSTERTMVPC